MNFTQSLQDELDNKYLDMLNNQAKEPMSYPDMGDYQVFERKNAVYHQRLEQELSRFNNAVRGIRAKRDGRIRSENNEAERLAEQKAHRKYVCVKTFKAIALFLPIVIAVLVGIDIFTNQTTYEVKASYGGVITGWVFFALISTVLSIFGLVKLFTKEIYHTRHLIENTKQYRNISIVATMLVAILCLTNFGVYISNGVDEAGVLTEYIATLPASDSIDFAEYDEDIAAAYSEYQSMAFWQKPLVENRDIFLGIVSKYNQFKADNVKTAMARISLETVADDDALENAVELYSKLTEEQHSLLTAAENADFKSFVTVYQLVNRIDAIYNDILNQYGTIDSLLARYNSLDNKYKPYVYNYDLVLDFDNQYLRAPRYSQVSTGMFITGDTNNPHSTLTANSFQAVDNKYISASFKDNTVYIRKEQYNDSGLAGVYSYVVFTIDTVITPHTEYTITYSYSMFLEKVANTSSKMWTCSELMYFGNEDKTSEAVLSRYGDLSPYGVRKLVADRSDEGDEKRAQGSFVKTYANNSDENIAYTDYFFAWGGAYPGATYRCGVDAYVTVDCLIEVASL